jgi:hypothetical protein
LDSSENTLTALATFTRPVEPSTVARVMAPNGWPLPVPVTNAASSSRLNASEMSAGDLC